MTLVVGANAGTFALVAADSRITTAWPNRLRTHVDCCQKALRIGDATVAGFCGDLVAIAEIVTTFSFLYQKDPALMAVERVESYLGRALLEGSKDFQSRTGRPFEVGLIVAGRRQDGKFTVLQCRSPAFLIEPVGCPGFAAIGSGEPVVERVASDFVRNMPALVSFSASTNTGPDILAWEIGTFVARHLSESGVDSVGRVLHTVCVESHDVTKVPYEIRTLSKLEEARVEYEVLVGTKTGPSGEWIQYSGRGDVIVLKNPTELVNDLDIFRRSRTVSW